MFKALKLLQILQQAFPFFHCATNFCFTMPNTGESWSNTDGWYHTRETWSNNDDWHQGARPQIVDPKSNEAVLADLSKPVHADDGQSDAGESTSELLFIPEKWG